MPARSGEGWIVEELGDGRSVVYWFTYHPDGRQAWTIGSASRDRNRLVIADNQIARGTHFGSSFNASDVQLRPWGPLEIDFASCDCASVSYASSLPGYGAAGSINGRFLMVGGSTVSGTAQGRTARVFELVLP